MEPVDSNLFSCSKTVFCTRMFDSTPYIDPASAVSLSVIRVEFIVTLDFDMLIVDPLIAFDLLNEISLSSIFVLTPYIAPPDIKARLFSKVDSVMIPIASRF